MSMQSACEAIGNAGANSSINFLVVTPLSIDDACGAARVVFPARLARRVQRLAS
jgi:hypothetical protein